MVALRGKTDEPIAPEVAPHPDEASGRARVLAITIVLAILVPLFGISLAVMILIERQLLKRSARIRTFLGLRTPAIS